MCIQFEGGRMMMKQLEKKIMEINAKLPEIPEKGKAVIAKWLWLGALIAVIIYVMGIVAILGMGALSSMLLFSMGLGFASIRVWIMVVTGVVGMGITLIAEILAIKPLKNLLYKGWYIAFCVVCFQLIFSLLYDITSNTLSRVLFDIISFAISMYILAQTREYFTEE